MTRSRFMPALTASRRSLGRATLLLSGVALATAGQPASAQDDRQVWGSITASGAVRGDLFVWLEGVGRATDDVGGGSQFMVRPGIGTLIGRDAHVVAGYAYVRTDPEGGAVSHEHRPWQQIQFVALRHADGTPLAISRTRLEQRMIEGRDGTGWRLRQFVRLQTPIKGEIMGVAFTEGFFNLNSTSGGLRNGVDQWRTFVGISIPVLPKARLEPGYLNQHVFRPGADRSNHALNISLSVRL